MSQQSKADLIEERKANLPLPDDPPVEVSLQSADARTVNVGSGGQPSKIANNALRSSASGVSDVRVDGDELHQATGGSNVGRQAHDDLGGIPNDAVSREYKDKTGTTNTTGKDYGYPEKSDPSSGIKK